ncbi:MAG: translation initiation factor IF-2 subunit beta [Candidatus Thermoplasmatota archaeon]|jgi:translation initiation factor 2 subunit 2|nr:translation initiation factor IF-2 subunit beta [Candidatus Thermoplasmatota archaeon]MCL5984118.1 translation initiation factor IF-2 subunit beta [Candidatus Thermoplasmatota archaeon]
MDSSLEYAALLDRALSQLKTGGDRGERFVVPQAEIMYDGRTTVVRNLKEISERLRREPTHVLNYLSREFGCQGVLDGPRGVLKSKVAGDQVNGKIRDYTNRFVMCLECKRPDTHIDKVGRVYMLICESCGAQRPVPQLRIKTA